MVKAKQNLKKAIMNHKMRENNKKTDLEYLPKFASPIGGFLAFWKSIDAAKTNEQVTF